MLLLPLTYPSKQHVHVARVPLSVSDLAIWHASRSCPLPIANQEKVVAKGPGEPVVSWSVPGRQDDDDPGSADDPPNSGILLFLTFLLISTSFVRAETIPGLGTATFPTSTHSAAAAHDFARGLLLLHLFEYDDAASSFIAAERRSPALRWLTGERR